jgi:tRNA-specific 2-thiouridylase
MYIAVAMSGGVDSAAAALILKERGHTVHGFHMTAEGHSEETWQNARRAATEIGMPIDRIDLRGELKALVTDVFVREYTQGRTPSPCPRCNRLIKFGILWDRVAGHGFDAQATGHYARIGDGPGGAALFRGVDRRRDQSYFLFMLGRDVLTRTILPLGDFTKNSVRAMAADAGLSCSQKEESRELCFVPDDDYRGFLVRQGVEMKPGPIRNTEGLELGRHQGIAAYTVGQRRGLGISAPRPLYVIKLDAASNTVIVGEREEAYVRALTASDVTRIDPGLVREGDRLEVQVRYTAPATPCTVTAVTEDRFSIVLDEPRVGVAPGQAAVLYRGDMVAGGGWIETTCA